MRCNTNMDSWKNLSDVELVEITLDKDTSAFDELVKRYQAPILRYCNRLLNFNQHDSEDATSETFFKAYKYLASYKSEYKFSSWLYRIAHNQAVNIIKKNSGFFTIDIESLFHLKAPSREVNTEITTTELEEILNQLKIDDKNILVLFYMEEKSLREIGDILNLTDNTVAQKLSRARKKAIDIIQSTSNNHPLL
jgi:RNA polymerase sigma-70 factor, ECF subfamily